MSFSFIGCCCCYRRWYPGIINHCRWLPGKHPILAWIAWATQTPGAYQRAEAGQQEL